LDNRSFLFQAVSPIDRVQRRLLFLAGLFLFLFSLTLTLSPAVRSRTLEVPYRWDHWLGYAVWAVLFIGAHLYSSRRMPERDPYFLPLAGLLSGWGLLTIWRLFPEFGQRQAIWLILAVTLLLAFLHLPPELNFLRRYKYLWLTLGLILTGLTLLTGTGPPGSLHAPRWLIGEGRYLQPSEPLKLLLIVYLSAYFASSRSRNGAPVFKLSKNLLPLLAPTLVMTGLALLLLVFQRDLGTATIFLFIYAVLVYLASGRKAILLVTGAILLFSGVLGYVLFDLVRIRVDAWINPWLDPSNRSFQIVQSLLAAANGGIFGRGPGLGSPGLVPVPHSDFIFTSIVEETGLFGAIGVLAVLAMLAVRGLRAALHAPDDFRRFLAAGLTAYLVAQSILITGGNLRLLPLTGVTLPFISYGGSSLLTSFLALGILVHISGHKDDRTQLIENPRPYLHLGGMLLSGLAAAALITGWWAFYRGPDLLTRPDNYRRGVADRFVPRGSILDRSLSPLVHTQGQPGSYTRVSLYPGLSPVTGYNHIRFGQSGLEASLDPYLSGMEGHPTLTLLWNRVAYGQPPPGLDIRLTLNIALQVQADELLSGRNGALVLLNPLSGEVLAMASHPNYDPNRLEEQWEDLLQDERAPLVNRATQGLYQPGTALGPFLLAYVYEVESDSLPTPPTQLSYQPVPEAALPLLDCARPPPSLTWGSILSAGCPNPSAALVNHLQSAGVLEEFGLSNLLVHWGLYERPDVPLPASTSPLPQDQPDPVLQALGQADLRISPLQLALLSASLSAGGQRPKPVLVKGVNLPGEGWTSLADEPARWKVFPPEAAAEAARALAADDRYWDTLALAYSGSEQEITWYIAGSLPEFTGDPFVMVILLEGVAPQQAQTLGQSFLDHFFTFHNVPRP
jgi:cell division protein FtsW (lipid II flippase)